MFPICCISPEQQKTIFEILVAPIIATFIGTIIGVIFGGYVTYRFGLLLAKRNEFRIIAGNLYQAFFDELLRLEERENIDTYKILAPALSKHQAAVFQFRQILPTKEQVAFDQAWKEYYCGRKQQKIGFLEQYADNGSLDKRKKYRKLALDRIHKIISFAGKR